VSQAFVFSCLYLTGRSQPDSGPHTNVVEDIHIDLAVDMIIEMYDADDGTTTHDPWFAHFLTCILAQRKLYIQMLNKLHLPDEVDENKLRKLKYLIGNYRIVRNIHLASKFGVRMNVPLCRTVHFLMPRAKMPLIGSQSRWKSSIPMSLMA
jgi:hypothetical protein